MKTRHTTVEKSRLGCGLMDKELEMSHMPLGERNMKTLTNHASHTFISSHFPRQLRSSRSQNRSKHSTVSTAKFGRKPNIHCFIQIAPGFSPFSLAAEEVSWCLPGAIGPPGPTGALQRLPKLHAGGRTRRPQRVDGDLG